MIFRDTVLEGLVKWIWIDENDRLASMSDGSARFESRMGELCVKCLSFGRVKHGFSSSYRRLIIKVSIIKHSSQSFEISYGIAIRRSLPCLGVDCNECCGQRLLDFLGNVKVLVVPS